MTQPDQIPTPTESALDVDAYDDPEPSANYVSCGCGFTATSDEPEWLDQFLTRHKCPNAPQPAPERWWDGVFSLPTVLIVAIVAVAIVRIFTGEGLFR